MASIDFSQTRASEPAPFGIPVTPATSLQRPQTLKAADTFLVADQYGDLSAAAPCAEGLFHADTRYLSRFAVTLNGSRFLLLGSNVTDDSEALRVHLTNPDFSSGTEVILERDSIHLLRTATLEPGCLTIRIDIRSYTQRAIEIMLLAEFECDFADIFEVRGFSRQRRGYRLTEQIDADTVLVAYRGLDEVVRCCQIAFDRSPDAIDSRHVRYRVALPPEGAAKLKFRITCWMRQDGQATAGPLANSPAVAQSDPPHVAAREVETSKELLNHWIARSQADLNMLITQKEQGLYPYAGIPWFSTAFGRDGLITALQCLWFFPELARGVLGYLAARQATRFDANSDAEPGKILHEERCGEMAALGEIPFGRYYGSVDATPLFVVLATGYWDRTNDVAFARTLWPHVQAALGWMRDPRRSGQG
jgi:glycogen debranching enzyme